MLFLQVILNGIVLGSLYACIAVGFSLVWGVLNVINLMHGSFIVLGSYLAWGAYNGLGMAPWTTLLIAAPLGFALGYAIQRGVLNRVIAAPVLVTLTLTFGLDLMLNNAMLVGFRADYRRLILEPALGSLSVGGLVVPVDRLVATAFALILTVALYLILRQSRAGRAIVAVRMDRDAARLMGVDVPSIYATAFGLGAAMAACAGVLLAMIFPISPIASGSYLGKAFVVCVLGGLGSVPGAVVGGLFLGTVESFGSLAFGPEHAVTLSFSLLILFLIFRPQGLMGKRGYE
ncbi:MAG: branched-chain amino acid ABC transporter permease [Polaromonas sp.]|uniref:branched-chain amino acid ABC transporter permease n=1 Tax=Polaromonas sp. TaxID=1869339 RepID=UPI002488B679|nr:branched-chain amino acid ABC transporter permease [Polaromonas sp.]MDI1269238.1 branched-chain amino acid ABC transporter permease [Polaromonas sp.]